MIGPMKEKYPNKVQIYTTKKDLEIYIHTKLVLIDDVYSPDGVTVLKLARDMRIRKFVEMTRLSYEDLNAMKFIDAADQFKVAAKDESTILTDFSVKDHLYYATFVDIFREQVDPQEVCTFKDSGSTRDVD
ncbi:unnamed protein product [Phytophthora lilii]|uniref:Unnamed protein product n=1 Tax=Phytophthora lilii TaxID=2077276 RepID=A0A9W6WYM4_9STRA|nr:unnamed protein product [Phytophthora lilii]